MPGVFDTGLDQRQGNYSPLTPLTLLQRSAHVYPHKPAVIDSRFTLSYAQFYERARRMASACTQLGIQAGDTVAIMCHNTAEMLESHYAIPMARAVLNTVNVRLDAHTLAYILTHGQARILIFDTSLENTVEQALQTLPNPPTLIAVDSGSGPTQRLTAHAYEAVLETGAARFEWHPPASEWDAISLNYTSGTTGPPKGVVYHHRGAYLSALGNPIAFGMGPETVYLWTLPMFHCNGWCYTWGVTAMGGTHVCLPRIDTTDIHDKITSHGVTHMCGAPIVLNMLINDFHDQGHVLDHTVRFAVGGAAPHSATLDRASQINFDITHLYGLTESFGPSAFCVWQPEWQSLSGDALADKLARQGVGLFAIDELDVISVDTGAPVAHDGQTLGELVMRGNTLMKGYLKNPADTDDAFRDGWFHTGDLAVMHPDGYVEIKDRLKDIIISGGENISSHEIENVLYRHPSVLEAAVVAQEDEKWGEVPCAFVTLREGMTPSAEELTQFCRQTISGFKVPRHFVFGELPKTSTGKIQKNVLRQFLKGSSGHVSGTTAASR